MSGQSRTLTFDTDITDAKTLAGLGRIRKGMHDTGTEAESMGKRGASSAFTLRDALGAVAIAGAGRFAIDEAEQAEVAERKMGRAIEATGNAAHISADEQQKLADTLGRKIALDNDDVSLAATRLRAYTAIKDQRFGEALAASADLAAAKNLDLEAAVDKVGKALNNPIKASKMLRSAGIELTQAQQDQIAAMVAAGDTAGAQGVILDELSSRYDGAAEAAVTGSQRAKVAMADAAETGGRVLAPGMELAADAMGFAADAVSHLPAPLQTATVGALGLAYAGPKVVDGISKIAPAGRQVLDFLSAVPGKGVGAVSTMTRLADTVASSPVAMTAGAAGVGVLTAAVIEFATQTDYANKNADELVSSAEATGKSIDEVFNDKLANTIAGLKDGFDLGDATDTFGQNLKQLGVDTSDLRDAVRGSDKDWEAFNDQLKRTALDGSQQTVATWVILRTQLDRLRSSGEHATAQQKDLTDAQSELRTETAKTTETTKEAADTSRDAEDANRVWYTSNADLAEQFRDQLQLRSDLNEEMRDSIQLSYDAVDAALAERSAHDSVRDATVALHDAEKGGASPVTLQRRRDDLTQAILREVRAADKAAESLAKQSGKGYDAAESARVQKARLNELESQTGFTSAELDNLNTSLDDAARERDVKLYTAAAEANAKRLIELFKELKPYYDQYNESDGRISPAGLDPRSHPSGQDPNVPAAGGDAAPTSGGDAPAGGRSANAKARGSDAAPPGALLHVETLNVGGGLGLGDLQIALREASNRNAQLVMAAS